MTSLPLPTSPLWILFLLSVFNVLPSESCPAGCRCVEKVEPLTVCVGLNMTSIPEDIPANTVELYFKDNNVRILHQNSFDRLPKLRTLHLTNCSIEQIEPNAFSGLTKLGALELQANKLTELQSYTFSGLFHLRKLVLDSNQLEVIHNFAFHGLNLTSLSLELNPNLRDISAKAFYGARIHHLYFYNSSLTCQSVQSLRPLQNSLLDLKLENNKEDLIIPDNLFQGFTFQSLNLNQNGIKDASFLEHIMADDLSLEGNPIGTIDFSQYPNLKQVRNLRLGNTKFSHIEVRYFHDMTHLSQLYLSGNGLTTIPDMRTIFNRLDRLSVEGNDLHCNCELLWFKQWSKATDVEVLGATCRTPVEADMNSMEEKEFKCSPPKLINISRSINISETNEVSLKCEAQGDPAPVIRWEMPDGDAIAKSPPIDRKLHGNVAVLTIKSTSETDAGIYKCIASNQAGNVSAVANLDVYRILHVNSEASTKTFSLIWMILSFVIASL